MSSSLTHWCHTIQLREKKWSHLEILLLLLQFSQVHQDLNIAFMICSAYFAAVKICKCGAPQLPVQLLASHKLGHKNVGPMSKCTVIYARNEVER